MNLKLAIKGALLTSIAAASLAAIFTTSAMACDSDCQNDLWDSMPTSGTGTCGAACSDPWPDDPWPDATDTDTYDDQGGGGDDGGDDDTTPPPPPPEEVDSYMECQPTYLRFIPTNTTGGIQVQAQYACQLYCDGNQVDTFFLDWRIAYPGTGFPGEGSSVTIPVYATSCN